MEGQSGPQPGGQDKIGSAGIGSGYQESRTPSDVTLGLLTPACICAWGGGEEELGRSPWSLLCWPLSCGRHPSTRLALLLLVLPSTHHHCTFLYRCGLSRPEDLSGGLFMGGQSFEEDFGASQGPCMEMAVGTEPGVQLPVSLAVWRRGCAKAGRQFPSSWTIGKDSPGRAVVSEQKLSFLAAADPRGQGSNPDFFRDLGLQRPDRIPTWEAREQVPESVQRASGARTGPDTRPLPGDICG